MKVTNRFRLSIDEKTISRHASLDQALEALKTTIIPRYSTGYIDSICAIGADERTFYTKEGNTIKRID